MNYLPIIVFYALSMMAVISAGMVILAKNSVRAVLSLVLTFFATAGVWLLLEAEFLAVTLVLVYVGAVLVLFLFVIMMLDVEQESHKEGFTRYLPLGLFIALVGLLILSFALSPRFFGSELGFYLKPLNNLHNTEALGLLLYSQYLYPFELAGIILLTAIIAAISLTSRKNLKSKIMDPAVQVQVNKRERLKIIKDDAWRDKI